MITSIIVTTTIAAAFVWYSLSTGVLKFRLPYLKSTSEVGTIIPILQMKDRDTSRFFHRHSKLKFEPNQLDSPGEGKGNPLKYSCLGNLTARGTWWDIVHGVTESDMTERLNHNWTPQSTLLHDEELILVEGRDCSGDWLIYYWTHVPSLLSCWN